MGGSLTLLDLAGSVALLLWGVHMVQTGVARAFGPELRRALAAALGDRLRGFLGGLGVTALLQSSTATGLMVASFAGSGLVEAVPALAVMLGAGVGTTLIVQLLSFDVSALASALILLGVVLFRRGKASRGRDVGRIAIGLGLMLLALHLLLGLVAPLAHAPGLGVLLGALQAVPLLAVLLAAALTWAAHSSVAVVLTVMSFAAQGVVPAEVALALVLGANLGTAINPVIEGAAGGESAGRRAALGFLGLRILGTVAALAALGPLARALAGWSAGPARAVADFHTGFNLALALAAMPFLGPYARLLARWMPERAEMAEPGRPRYLEAAARASPPLALAAAAREALRMADTLAAMLAGLEAALLEGDRNRVGETKRLDDVLDRLNGAIKAYLTGLDQGGLEEADQARLTQILTFCTNLEHAGDVIERNLMALAAKRLKRGVAFSEEGQGEIARMVERLAADLRAAVAVFMTADGRAARALAAEKEAFRALEAEATSGHFARLRAGRVESAETSSLHLDAVRDMKRVNAHLVAAAAYPVLEAGGELLASRVRG